MTHLGSLCKLVWHRMSFSSPAPAAVGCSAITEQELPRVEAVHPRGGFVMTEAAAQSTKEYGFVLQHSRIVQPHRRC